jgi:hypothetical protein
MMWGKINMVKIGWYGVVYKVDPAEDGSNDGIGPDLANLGWLWSSGVDDTR